MLNRGKKKLKNKSALFNSIQAENKPQYLMNKNKLEKTKKTPFEILVNPRKWQDHCYCRRILNQKLRKLNSAVYIYIKTSVDSPIEANGSERLLNNVHKLLPEVDGIRSSSLRTCCFFSFLFELPEQRNHPMAYSLSLSLSLSRSSQRVSP